jgi:hypothetical protein
MNGRAACGRWARSWNMKVVYEDPVIKRIERAVYDADLAGCRIGYIEVTVREANELSEHVRRNLWLRCGTDFMHYTKADAGKVVGRCYGVKILVGSE